jgi:transcriptional regulator with XRE-family HTH domain
VEILRRSLGVTQYRLAQRLRGLGWEGCDQRQISTREAGECVITAAELLLFARALGVGPATILHPEAVHRLCKVEPGRPRTWPVPFGTIEAMILREKLDKAEREAERLRAELHAVQADPIAVRDDQGARSAVAKELIDGWMNERAKLRSLLREALEVAMASYGYDTLVAEVARLRREADSLNGARDERDEAREALGALMTQVAQSADEIKRLRGLLREALDEWAGAGTRSEINPDARGEDIARIRTAADL